MSNPRDVLVAYSQQQASTEQVWRALTEHTGWYVPAAFAVTALHTEATQNAVIFAPEMPITDHALVLFTDRVAAAHAEGAPLGVFASEFSGIQIFQALDTRFGSVRINPHSPKSESWFISQEAFPLAKLWAGVVHLEQALAANQPSSAEIAAHPGFLILLNSQNLPITLNSSDGSYAVAFPSPDRYHAFVAQQPAEHQANMKSATLDGAKMCEVLADFDVAGVAIFYSASNAFFLSKDQFAATASAS